MRRKDERKLIVVLLKRRRKRTCSKALFQAHVEHLKALEAAGVLVMCGPFTDADGAIQIFQTKNKREALRYLKKDPFVLEAYYRDYDVHELSDWRWDGVWRG